jgi:hypothetical protein
MKQKNETLANYLLRTTDWSGEQDEKYHYIKMSYVRPPEGNTSGQYLAYKKQELLNGEINAHKDSYNLQAYGWVIQTEEGPKEIDPSTFELVPVTP